MMYGITRRKFVTTASHAAALTLGANIRIDAGLYIAGGDKPLSGLDDYCQQAIADWQVPGIAAAVIRDGQLLMARGYGVRELGKDAPINENTIFHIASCTKSFTAAMVGKLVDQNSAK
ncbi:MAG: serine hydrolase domain-containing protein [Fuerstiella sp.]